MRQFRRSERGTAVVEFALVAPLLFLIVFGIVDFGRALNYYNDLTQLAGQGARAAAVDRNPDGTPVGAPVTNDGQCQSVTYSIQCQLVNTYTTTAELKSGISVCIPSLPAVGSPVTVRATYTFTFIPLVHAASIKLSATQSELAEVPPTYTAGDQSGSPGGNACSP